MTISANLYGVWTKWERAIEQLDGLDCEVQAFGTEPNAWTTVTHVDRSGDGVRYVFRFDPGWQPKMQMRWGAIVGEIVHNFRSSLDQLVAQFVILNGGTVSRDHAFPIRSKEPAKSFAEATCYTRRDSRNRLRHGPLYGVASNALALIERCQPYKGSKWLPLARLHYLWNLDKHESLVPTRLLLFGPVPTLRDAYLVDRVADRFDGSTYVVEFTVIDTSLDAHVDVQPQTPHDITFGDGRSVIGELKTVGVLIMNDVLRSAIPLFPDDLGHPTPFRFPAS